MDTNDAFAGGKRDGDPVLEDNRPPGQVTEEDWQNLQKIKNGLRYDTESAMIERWPDRKEFITSVMQLTYFEMNQDLRDRRTSLEKTSKTFAAVFTPDDPSEIPSRVELAAVMEDLENEAIRRDHAASRAGTFIKFAADLVKVADGSARRHVDTLEELRNSLHALTKGARENSKDGPLDGLGNGGELPEPLRQALGLAIKGLEAGKSFRILGGLRTAKAIREALATPIDIGENQSKPAKDILRDAGETLRGIQSCMFKYDIGERQVVGGNLLEDLEWLEALEIAEAAWREVVVSLADQRLAGSLARLFPDCRTAGDQLNAINQDYVAVLAAMVEATRPQGVGRGFDD